MAPAGLRSAAAAFTFASWCVANPSPVADPPLRKDGTPATLEELRAAHKARAAARDEPPPPPPLLVESWRLAGGIQSLLGIECALRRDADGDLAHEFYEAIKGGRKYLIYLLTTSVGLALPAMIIVYQQTGTLDFTGGGVFQETSATMLTVLLVMFLYGFAKAGLMPFHAWLPGAMVVGLRVMESPVASSRCRWRRPGDVRLDYTRGKVCVRYPVKNQSGRFLRRLVIEYMPERGPKGRQAPSQDGEGGHHGGEQPAV